jgi:hypothetical protein
MNTVYHNTTFFRMYLKHRSSTKSVLSSDLQITTILLLCIQLLIPTSPIVLIPIWCTAELPCHCFRTWRDLKVSDQAYILIYSDTSNTKVCHILVLNTVMYLYAFLLTDVIYIYIYSIYFHTMHFVPWLGITNKCINSYQFIISLCCCYMFQQLCATLRDEF